jgi:hypothetical protein
MKTLLTLAVILCLTTGCKKDKEADTRSFYMAVTPWPADFTPEAVNDAYDFINSHCDMVSHHFDEGIPYEEAYNHLAWPQQLQNDLAFRKTKTAAGKKILLSVAPLNLTRHQKADYYSHPDAGITDSIKNYWNQLAVNDPKVVTSYVRYVSYLIDQLEPQFVNYGVESNDVHWDGSHFAAYKDFLSKVLLQLRAAYPQLPFFISFMVNEDPAALSLTTQLLPYSDYIGLSAYPYASASTTADGNTDPKKFPADYFTRFLNLAPDKPWCFAETGYIAQNLVIPSYSLNRQGTAQWQNDYLNMICKLCNDRKAKFLVWFCHADYDAGSDRLRAMGLYDDLFGLWQDIGLKDEHNVQRPAYQLWLQWQGRKYK